MTAVSSSLVGGCIGVSNRFSPACVTRKRVPGLNLLLFRKTAGNAILPSAAIFTVVVILTRMARSPVYVNQIAVYRQICSFLRPSFVFHLGLESSGTALAGVADVLGFAEIDNFLGNVGGMVADAFQAFGDDHQAEAPAHRFRVAHHMV